MFQQLLEYYDSQVGNGDDEGEWAAAEALSQDDTWFAIQEKLNSMNEFLYPFAEEEFIDIDELLGSIRRFLLEDAEDGQGQRINELYGRNQSDRRYKDLIELAKLIALYRHDRNYHRVLLCDDLPNESGISMDSLYLMPHSQLCPVWNRIQPTRKFDLIPYEDLMPELQASNRLRNFYNYNQPIDPAITISHIDSPYYEQFKEFSANVGGVITRPTYYALKAFVEVVANEYDAGHSLEGCWYRGRVAVKFEAFCNLCGFIESLPADKLADLRNIQVCGLTFGEQVHAVAYQEACASQFADDIAIMLFQFNPRIEFTNPRAQDIIDRNRNGLPLRGTVLKTEGEDRKYLENMCKVILNTEFDVILGTKVSSINGEQSNRVPSHVAEMFEICKLGLEGGMNFSEARYKAIEVAARCYRNPHNSALFFMNTRDPKTHNFYGMVINSNFTDTIENNERLDDHNYYVRGLPSL